MIAIAPFAQCIHGQSDRRSLDTGAARIGRADDEQHWADVPSGRSMATMPATGLGRRPRPTSTQPCADVQDSGIAQLLAMPRSALHDFPQAAVEGIHGEDRMTC
ncbi:MAG: hypothetical protein KAY46_19445 [Burkholderiaceae bacterium]|nr:hypothetical protein [Burkholderiaceae bacterium]